MNGNVQSEHVVKFGLLILSIDSQHETLPKEFNVCAHMRKRKNETKRKIKCIPTFCSLPNGVSDCDFFFVFAVFMFLCVASTRNRIGIGYVLSLCSQYIVFCYAFQFYF